MRRKIQNMIRGRFETDDAKLIFSEEKIHITVMENEYCQDSFVIRAEGESRVRGLVDSPDPNMICLTGRFDTSPVTIRYEYHAEGMLEGEERESYFVITSNVGEYLLPFHVRVSKKYAHSSIGWIRNLDDFTNLAKLNWAEALRLFRSVRFPQVFHQGDERQKALYLALINRGTSSAQMEEFLVGCGKKERCHFQVDSKKQTFVVGNSPISDSIDIDKSEWGYLQLSVTCSSPFIEIQQGTVEDLYSLGRHMHVDYRILPENMHGGENYARICLEDIEQICEIEISAVSENFHSQRTIFSRNLRLSASLLKLWMEYRMQHTSKKEWRDISVKLLDQLKELEPENLWVDLFKAYIYLNCEERDLADMILSRFEEKNDRRKSPVEGFYEYLTTYTNPEPKYIRDVTYSVRELYREFRGHPVLAWILLTTDGALLRNEERAFLFLKHYMTEYSNSPVFYMEAYFLVRDNPDLVTEMDDFERRLIRWMVRHELLTEELTDLVIRNAAEKNVFEPWFWRMLRGCYKLYPSTPLLKAICSYLIKLNIFGDAYFSWYEMGVRAHVRVAGLYEAFIRSWDSSNDSLPQEIIKYFMMVPDIPWKWRAGIYAYLIRHQQEAGGEWEKWRPKVCEFAEEMLKKQQLNGDLYELYVFLRKEIGTQEWKRICGNIEDSWKITVTSPKIVHICVYDPDSREMKNLPLKKHCAYTEVRSPYTVILLQDLYGNLYVPAPFTGRKRLFPKPAETEKQPDAEADTVVMPDADPQTLLVQSLERSDQCLDDLDRDIIKAKEEGIFVIPYEETILSRMLFTGKFSTSHEIFFRDLCEHHENAQICDAYVSLFSREYISGRRKLSKPVISYIRTSLQGGRRLNDFCLVSLLKYQYAGEGERPLSVKAADAILREILLKGKIFDFFNGLPLRIKRRYLLEGLLFLQYRGRENMKCRVEAQIFPLQKNLPEKEFLAAGDPEKEILDTMPEVLSGIYCAAVPVLPDSRVHYRLLNEDGRLLEENDRETGPVSDVPDQESAFKRLAELLRSDSGTSERKILDYANRMDLVEALFPLNSEDSLHQDMVSAEKESDSNNG